MSDNKHTIGCKSTNGLLHPNGCPTCITALAELLGLTQISENEWEWQ